MKYTHALCVICIVQISFINNGFSSDYGVTGLIDIPTARMSTDGVLTTTAAIQSRTNSYSITYQATPWLEGAFRYTGFNDFYYWDRNYEAKLRLWPEQSYIPQVAVGIRDLVGTGIFGSEYVVATKRISNLDLTIGMGWGRLAGDGDFKNPMTILSQKFKNRTRVQGGMGTTGVFQPGQWFSGEKAGLFGGLQYKFRNLPLALIVEYNPDQYDWDREFGFKSRNREVPEPNSPLSAALKWSPRPDLIVTLSNQHDQEWGIEVSAKLDTKSLPTKPSPRLFKSSLDFTQADLPSGINRNSWYDTLLFDVERSGILLLEATIDEAKYMATLVMGNTDYALWRDAVAVLANLADLHLPSIVNRFEIVIEEEGHRPHAIQMRRPSLNFGRIPQLMELDIKINPVKQPKFVQYKTNFVQNKVIFDVNLANRVQLFDPNDPLRYQLYVNIGLGLMLSNSWLLSGMYGYDIVNNFDESKRVSNSVLQRVRSDVLKYLTQGESGLDSLFIQKRGSFRGDIHYRVYGGILETMYSGVGGEVLYQPFRSRLALGLSANYLKQRYYDKSFKHLEYQTATAFASAYWATPFYNFDVAVHAGQYLARDVGATLEIRRTFDNGWMVGVWATKTDVSAEDFGEGSFDKGFFFKIPLNGLFGNNSRASYINRMRPIQRDGGQYLEDFSGSLWWQLRGARFDAFIGHSERMLR